MLASVDHDELSSIYIFDWRKGTLLTRAKAQTEAGSSVLSVCFNRYLKEISMVTCGVGNVMFW